MLWAQDEFLCVPRLTIDKLLSSPHDDVEARRPQSTRLSKRTQSALDVPPAPLSARLPTRRNLTAALSSSDEIPTLPMLTSPLPKSRYVAVKSVTGAPAPPPSRLGIGSMKNLGKRTTAPKHPQEQPAHPAVLNKSLAMQSLGSHPPQSIRAHAPEW